MDVVIFELTLFASSLAVFIVLWAIQIKTRNATSVDAAWAALIGIQGVALTLHASGDAPPEQVLRFQIFSALLAAWAARLSRHLMRRHRTMTEEDARYAHLRAQSAGKGQFHEQKVFLGMYLLQWIVAGVFSLTMLGVIGVNEPIGAWDYVCAGFGVMCLILEWHSDETLSKFVRDPKNRGKPCEAGFWKYSRHPNYFFEWLFWWSFALAARGSEHAWVSWGVVGLLYVLLTKLSGIPWAEKSSLRSKGDRYREYQTRVSPFFPMPRRSSGAQSLR